MFSCAFSYRISMSSLNIPIIVWDSMVFDNPIPFNVANLFSELNYELD